MVFPIVPASTPPERRWMNFEDDQFAWISPYVLNGRGDWDNASGFAFLRGSFSSCLCQPSPNFWTNLGLKVARSEACYNRIKSWEITAWCSTVIFNKSDIKQSLISFTNVLLYRTELHRLGPQILACGILVGKRNESVGRSDGEIEIRLMVSWWHSGSAVLTLLLLACSTVRSSKTQGFLLSIVAFSSNDFEAGWALFDAGRAC